MNFSKKSLAGLMIVFSGAAQAQVPSPVNTIDLSGNFVRIGLSLHGTIGSIEGASPGILYDNTGTGTFNTAYDYLTPGSPFEGFSVKFTNSSGASILHANNNTGYGRDNPIAGSLYDYSGIAYGGNTFDHRGVWIGGNSSFDIINDVSFGNNQKFVDLVTTITAKEVMTNLYFARYTDPDAVAAPEDSSATDNARGYNVIPGTNVVFSEATQSRYALGLYSGQSGNVNTGISADWSTDPEVYFNGVDDGNGDNTIGVAFRVPTLGIGEVATFRYSYIFGPSAFEAGRTAVDEGAGGGTPGTVPGCTGSCALTDTGPASDPTTPPPPPPTLVSTDTDTITGSVTTLTRHPAARTLTIRDTTVTTSMTRTTETYSDSSTVVTDSTPTTDTAVTNYSTRVDQMDYLARANNRLNATLDSDVLDRHSGVEGVLRPKANLAGSEERGWTYVIADGQSSSTVDTYSMRTSRYGLGHEKNVRSNWLLGAQYNHLNSTLEGQGAGGGLDKHHVGLYSLANLGGWLIKTDLGVAATRYTNSHSLAALGASNVGTTNGLDAWLSNRVYTPAVKGFRPFVGVRVENNTYDAFRENGTLLTAMSYDAVNTVRTHGEVGVRGEARVRDTMNLVAEASSRSDDLMTAKLGFSFAPGTRVLGGVSAVYQRQHGVNNNMVQATIKVAF